MAYINKPLSDLYKQNLRYILNEKNIVQSAISLDLGLSKNVLSTYLTQDRVPSIILSKSIATYCGVSLDAFFTDNIEAEHYLYSVTEKLRTLNSVRIKNVDAYIESQLQQQYESTIKKIVPKPGTKKRKKTKESPMVDYLVSGNSMAPLFTNNMVIQVDTQDYKHLIDGAYYALQIDDSIYLKQVIVSPDGRPTLELHSLNYGFDTTYLDQKQKFDIIGRVHATITI